MATVELAAALPVLVIMLGVALTALSVVGQRVRAMDAAREVARAAARGDPAAAGRYAQLTAPRAQVAVTRSGEQVRVQVRIAVRPLGPLVPPVTVVETAVAAVEPSATNPDESGRSP